MLSECISICLTIFLLSLAVCNISSVGNRFFMLPTLKFVFCNVVKTSYVYNCQNQQIHTNFSFALYAMIICSQLQTSFNEIKWSVPYTPSVVEPKLTF